MAGGSGGRSLEQTPTWAVATVCFVLVIISISIEQIINMIGQWFKKKNERALCESLEKIKAELMLLGFISLLLTVGTTPITKICISESAASTWHLCARQTVEQSNREVESRRRLLTWSNMGESNRRILAGSSGGNKCAEQGKVSFMSYDGVHELHIFIFILAVSHVLYSILTMALGRAKMRSWKRWEKETTTMEYQFSHDSKRFRFARNTSFGRRHMSFWSKSPILLWIVCFFRQFVHSVHKVDYLTLRHGFIMAHLAPNSHSRFDFQKYITRSLQEDFKVVVDISPPIWLFAVVFLLFNTHGWYSYLWLPFLPLMIVLLVGTKLQVIITKMGLKIEERGEIVKGVPIVQPGDDLFWFNRPRLLLHLLNLVLFEAFNLLQTLIPLISYFGFLQSVWIRSNAFQLAFFTWTVYRFGLKSCIHEHTEDAAIRITMGVLIQIICSYVTLPLYALVTQMGSTMRPTILNDRVASALRKWHHAAKKHIKESKKSGHVTPMPSRPGTPSNSHNLSPVHLLAHYQSNVYLDSFHTSPRKSNYNENWHIVASPPPGHHEVELSYVEEVTEQVHENQHEVIIGDQKEWSFDKRPIDGKS